MIISQENATTEKEGNSCVYVSSPFSPLPAAFYGALNRVWHSIAIYNQCLPPSPSLLLHSSSVWSRRRRKKKRKREKFEAGSPSRLEGPPLKKEKGRKEEELRILNTNSLSLSLQTWRRRRKRRRFRRLRFFALWEEEVEEETLLFCCRGRGGGGRGGKIFGCRNDRREEREERGERAL